MFRTWWTARQSVWLSAAATLGGALLVLLVVDLSPRVAGDFFFAEDDPQMRESVEISTRFPTDPQVILRIEDESGGQEALRRRVEALATALAEVEGVADVYSIATEDPERSPLFARLLSTGEPNATNILLQTDGTDGDVLLPRLEAVVASHEEPSIGIVLSGVPVIVEQIRRSLFRDLVVFSAASVLVFGLLLGLVYRDPVVVAGTLATCLISVSLTLLAVHALDVGIGLLTANLVTIVFVLTLSHVVFLTANWRRASSQPGHVGDEPVGYGLGGADEQAADEATGDEPVGAGPGGEGGHEGDAFAGTVGDVVVRGVGDTLEGSFWAMATTLLGFSSLLITSAKPLRELGLAGVIGTVCAFLVAFLVYPTFLVRSAVPPRSGDSSRTDASSRPDASSRSDTASLSAGSTRSGASLPPDASSSSTSGGAASTDSVGRASRWVIPAAALLATALAGTGVFDLDTDPGLLSYFSPGSALREGLEVIDRDGGSSTLDLVIRDDQGGRIDGPPVFEELVEFQRALESDTAVGQVLSPTVLIEHARTFPLAGFLPVRVLLDLAASPRLGGVASSYVTESRDEARFFLRMRETVEAESRTEVMERLEAHAGQVGLEVTARGGLYDLQAQLGALIASSLRVGIGGLLALFAVIAWLVSRSVGTAARMWVCLAAVPLVVLGIFGHMEIAVDIITSPAANIALAIGVDAMIHLVVRVRQLGRSGTLEPWRIAVTQIRPPVVAATATISAGFGIFVLSTFPPTRRFGLAVILGTLTAAFMALTVLPRLSRGVQLNSMTGRSG